MSSRRPARKSAPQNYLHAAARTYHDMDLPITLCKGKAPWQPDWPTLVWTPRTIDAVYKLHAAANVGLVLGQRSGLVDFECDSPEAEETLLELFDGRIPETPTWSSRRGLHRLFRWHPALEQLGKSKLTLGEDGLEILIGPGVQTLLPPSWADGVKREWVRGENLLPNDAASIPDAVLCRLGCPPGAGTAAAVTDSNPTSVVSVVSVVSVPSTQDPTTQRVMAVVRRCLVSAQGTTNDKILALAIGLKGLPELAGTMAEELEPYIRYWYEMSLPFMQEKDWQAVWERWLYLWVWAKPGHDTVRMAYEAAMQEPLPACAMQYPIQAMRELVALCSMMQRRYANEREIWFLACRSAEEVLGISHNLAAKLLKRLVDDGVLEVGEESTTFQARRYRYRGD